MLELKKTSGDYKGRAKVATDMAAEWKEKFEALRDSMQKVVDGVVN